MQNAYKSCSHPHNGKTKTKTKKRTNGKKLSFLNPSRKWDQGANHQQDLWRMQNLRETEKSYLLGTGTTDL
jgi:hypothetical protein